MLVLLPVLVLVLVLVLVHGACSPELAAALMTWYTSISSALRPLSLQAAAGAQQGAAPWCLTHMDVR